MNHDQQKPAGIVFLFDVDNTLLDNDGVTSDLKKHLEEEVGPAVDFVGDGLAHHEARDDQRQDDDGEEEQCQPGSKRHWQTPMGEALPSGPISTRGLSNLKRPQLDEVSPLL